MSVTWGRGEPRIGWFGEDAWDWAVGAGETVLETAADIFEGIPGSEYLVKLVEGPLREFAQSDIGKTVLRAVATTLTMGVAPFLGPQLASVMFATPGLFRGEPFVEAWVNEFRWRVETTAQILGPQIAESVGAGVETALKKIEETGGAWARESAEWIARELGISDWAAAQAKALWNKAQLPRREDYDELGRFRPKVTAAHNLERLTRQVVATVRPVSAVAQAVSGARLVSVAPRSSAPAVTSAPVRFADAPARARVGWSHLALAGAAVAVVAVGAAYALQRDASRAGR